MEIIKSIQINRSPEDVFAYISNFSNHKHIYSANIDSKQLSDGPVGVGTRMRNIAKFMGKKMEEHFVVISYSPNDHIKKESAPGSTVYTWDMMSVKPLNKGTLFTLTVYAKPSGYFKIFGPLLKPMVARVFKKDVCNLKRILET